MSDGLSDWGDESADHSFVYSRNRLWVTIGYGIPETLWISAVNMYEKQNLLFFNISWTNNLKKQHSLRQGNEFTDRLFCV